MPQLQSSLIDTLWRGKDPFNNFPSHLYEVDIQGWGSQHPYLIDHIDPSRPIHVEIGTWKGASVIAVASRMRDLGIDGAVIAVDTWLGAADHWTDDQWFHHLAWDHGYPSLNRKFMANIIHAGLTDYVVPLPLDSVNAAEVLKHFKISADIVHVDAGHEYDSVIADLRAWWEVLRPGGHYIGDDYYDEIHWPGVKKAHNEFFSALGLFPFEFGSGKCRLNKPEALLPADRMDEAEQQV